MLFVACSGFPGPVSRYWGLFQSVEISDTEIGIPGRGTVRRWLRESPEGFVFTALAPKAIGESGFETSKENGELLDAFREFVESVNAKAIVFKAPDDLENTPKVKGAISDFLKWLSDDFPQVILDIPGWPTKDVEAAAAGRAVVAYDPLLDDAPMSGAFVYARLPGPAGHRSRYDDESVDKIAEHCAAINAEAAFCVFRNIDMEANGTALRAKLEGEDEEAQPS